MTNIVFVGMLPNDCLVTEAAGNARRSDALRNIRERWLEGHRAIPRKRRPNVLKKTCVAGGMLIATAAGTVITSLPAFAEVPAWGGGGCCSSSHSSFFHHARNRNWNGNESENFNRIRLRIH